MLSTRLRNQRLTGTTFRRADQVVSWLGAVQAQDYAGAQWGVALRARGLTVAAIDRAFDAGEILRTHVLRPTWHLVTPADLRWMLALTGPRLRRLLATYDRRLEIDARLLTRVRRIVESALEGGRFLTRDALAEALRARGRITAAGQRLAHLVMYLEADAVICSGPRQGKQFTYALVAERTPGGATLSRDDALSELARRYFQSHGPATVHDFSWWSGLTMRDARTAVATVPGELVLRTPPPLESVAGCPLPAAQLRRVSDRLQASRRGDRPATCRATLACSRASSIRITSSSTAASPAAGVARSGRQRPA